MENPITVQLIVFICGILIGILIARIAMSTGFAKEKEALRVFITRLETEKEMLLSREKTLVQERDNAQENVNTLTAENKRLETGSALCREKIQWLESADAKLRETFSSLAAESLERSSEAMMKRFAEYSGNLRRHMQTDLESHRDGVNAIFQPVKEGIATLGERVRELESKREGAYREIREQLREMGLTHSRLTDTTSTLAQALAAPTIRGQWGELQLKRVAEASGMVRHISFAEQKGEGKGRPDMLVYLPDSGVVAVDAKTPLSAYLKAMEAKEDAVRKKMFQDFAKDVRKRVKELSGKQYWEEIPGSPEFVVMFMPNETALYAAFEADPGLLEDALDQKVLIASPVTLVGLLKSCSYGWRTREMAEAAKAAAREAGELQKRLMLFMKRFSSLGTSLNKTLSAYNQAAGSLTARVLPIVDRMSKSGAEKPPDPPAPLETPAVSLDRYLPESKEEEYPDKTRLQEKPPAE